MHQYLFFIGSFPVRAYGLLFMLGIISSGLTAYYIMKRDGRGWHVHIFDFTMYCGLAGIVGGRLWDVFFFDWAYYQHHLTEIPYVWQGGMAIQGGLLFGAIAGYLYTKHYHIDTWAFGDLLAPAIILGQSMTPSAIRRGVISASSIPNRPWPIRPTAASPYGRPKYGKDRSTSWSSSPSSFTAPSPTRRARYSASTSCSTPSNGSSWNFSAATTST